MGILFSKTSNKASDKTDKKSYLEKYPITPDEEKLLLKYLGLKSKYH